VTTRPPPQPTKLLWTFHFN